MASNDLKPISLQVGQGEGKFIMDISDFIAFGTDEVVMGLWVGVKSLLIGIDIQLHEMAPFPQGF